MIGSTIICVKFPAYRFRGHFERGGREILRQSKDGKEYYEMLSPLSVMAMTHMDSQQLWLPAQNLHKIKPVKTSRTENEKDPDAPHVSEKLLTVDGWWDRKTQYSGGVAAGRFLMLNRLFLIYVPMDSTNLIQWVAGKENMTLWESWESWMEWTSLIIKFIVHMYKFFKELKRNPQKLAMQCENSLHICEGLCLWKGCGGRCSLSIFLQVN